MNILVTGANGFMGHGIITELAKSGNKIIASDFSDFNQCGNNIISKPGNLFELQDPYNYFDQPDVLLHLAWRDGFKHNSENHINDLPLHFSFIKKMVEKGIKKVVVLGSMHEIGYFEGCIDENTPCNPLSNYGIAKNALRQLLSVFLTSSKTSFQWIRGFYIVDNTPKGSSIFSKIIQAEERGDERFPFTSGKNKYDFLDYDDFCKQVASITLNNNVFGIINACSGKPESLASRVERFIDENNLSIKLEYGVFPDRIYDSPAIWGDNSLVRKILKESEK